MPTPAIRVFLDANVLFSAVYRVEAPLTRLWMMKNLALVTSAYAAAEAGRNLSDTAQHTRLNMLLARLEMREGHVFPELPERIELPAKDRPILQAAIAARVAYLLTGDRTHFGRYYEHTIEGVTILSPAALDAPSSGQEQRIGFMIGQIQVPDDFDHMMAGEIEQMFESPE